MWNKNKKLEIVDFVKENEKEKVLNVFGDLVSVDSKEIKYTLTLKTKDNVKFNASVSKEVFDLLKERN